MSCQINCPYYQSQEVNKIHCKRGHVRRTAEFTKTYILDKHIRRHCSKEYTRCNTYRKLENDWGAPKKVDMAQCVSI
jgi:hypothetical protein